MNTSSPRLSPADETSRTSILVPRAATIDGFVAAASAGDGLDVRGLEPLTTLHVRTCNSCYRIVIAKGTAVFVQGGRFFAETTDARLEGSSAGGSLLKLGWIGVGLCMELWAQGQRIVTSPVRSITREEPDARPQ
ncbi:MAG: hypothetical protein HYU37_00550 [Acidobacteria bacterium]|nr:hypothetical protein [Acidobacteriota bacterium]